MVLITDEYFKELNLLPQQLNKLNNVIDILIEWQDKVFEVHPNIDSEMKAHQESVSI